MESQSGHMVRNSDGGWISSSNLEGLMICGGGPVYRGVGWGVGGWHVLLPIQHMNMDIPS